MTDKGSVFQIINKTCCRQRGAAVLLLLLFIVLGIAASFAYVASDKILERQQQLKTEKALLQARKALISYAVSADRPGELPCPDIDNDGKIDGVVGNCAGLRGWLPWFRLGLGDLKDGYGERLWYVLDDAFRPHGNVPPGLPLNPDTQTSIAIYGADPDVIHDLPYIAALVISPGESLPVNSPDRTFEKLEDMTADDIVASYLEMKNADIDIAAYTMQAVTEDFNDRMMIITVDQLMKPVQRRVKQTVVSQVEKFYSGNGFYPYAEAIPGRSCDGSSVATEGYLQLAVVPGCQYAESLGFPQWFAENEWHRMFWAAFDASCQINAGGPAESCAGGLSAGTNNVIESLVIFSGKGLNGVSNSCGAAYTQSRPSDLPCDYFDDIENYDLDGVFVQPASSESNNDELIIVRQGK